MEKEWERNEKKNKTILESKFEGMEWIWNGNVLGERVGGICGVNGKKMEWNFFLTNQVEINWNEMEMEWN